MKNQRKGRKRLSVDIPDILEKRLRKLSDITKMTKTRSVIRALLMYCTYEEINVEKKES